MPDIAAEQCKREGEEGKEFTDADFMLTENFQQPGEQRSARAEQSKAAQIERAGAVAEIIGHVFVDEILRQQADGQVDEKDLAPGEEMHDEAAHRRPQQRADEGGDDDEIHGRQQLGLLEGADDGEAADGHHHRSADALQDARCHQHRYADGEAAEHR